VSDWRSLVSLVSSWGGEVGRRRLWRPVYGGMRGLDYDFLYSYDHLIKTMLGSQESC